MRRSVSACPRSKDVDRSPLLCQTSNSYPSRQIPASSRPPRRGKIRPTSSACRRRPLGRAHRASRHPRRDRLAVHRGEGRGWPQDAPGGGWGSRVSQRGLPTCSQPAGGVLAGQGRWATGDAASHGARLSSAHATSTRPPPPRPASGGIRPAAPATGEARTRARIAGPRRECGARQGCRARRVAFPKLALYGQ